MNRPAWIALALVAVVAVGSLFWWTQIREVSASVDFELRISSSQGCAGTHPKYGSVYGYVDLVLRNPDDSLIAKVPLHKSAGTNSLYCVMISVADIPVKDVYRVQIDSLGTVSNGGLIDRHEIESGSVVLIDP